MTSPYIEIDFNKPLFGYEGGYFIYLRDKYLKQAKGTGKPMRINTPQGIAIYTYEEWLKGAKRMEQVYKFKDRPMKLIGNYIEIGHGQPNMEEYEDSRLKMKKLWKNIEAKLKNN